VDRSHRYVSIVGRAILATPKSIGMGTFTVALKVYEGHLAREIYGATILVTVAFLTLFAFFDLINEFKDIGRGNYQFQHAFGFVLLTLPGRAYEILPICVLIGTLYALTLLARNSEITVLRAAGLSTKEFLWSLMKVGSVFVVLTLLIGEAIAPPAERYAQQIRLQFLGAMIASEFRSGLWVKDDYSFVNVREVRPDASLNGIRIYEFDQEFKLHSISEAPHGVYLGNKLWRLTDVVRTVFERDSSRVEHDIEMDWKSGLTPDVVSVLMVVPERMSLMTLMRYVNYLGGNQQKTERYEIALWKKLVYPLATLVMMVLALPFAYMQDRMGSVSVRVFAGVMLGIGFHMLNGLLSSLGVINNWLPFISAITPSVMFLMAGAALVWWVERR
jgi:lipopolysaccharide export system permease protein